MLRAISQFNLAENIELHVLPGFQDNYFYVLENSLTQHAAAIDPGRSAEVQACLEQHNLTLTHILLTHHHNDHTGGVESLLKTWPGAEIICSSWFNVKPSWTCKNLRTLNPDEPDFEILGCNIYALDVRGHTVDHIAFVLKPKNSPQPTDVFVGDALFGAGCGGLFEGTYPQMLVALKNLRALPSQIRLWCAHEYTLKNLRVATLLGEDNHEQKLRLEKLEAMVAQANVLPHESMTLPLILSDEIATNPFLRWDSPSLQKTIDTRDELETFTYVRRFRDQF